MSKTKNKNLLILLPVPNREKSKEISDLKSKQKKELIKVYENQSPLLPRRMLKKIIDQKSNIGSISPQNKLSKMRYQKKIEMSQFLEDTKMSDSLNHTPLFLSPRKKPQSLLKISQKISMLEVRSRRERQFSENNQKIENHSMDLLKIKRSKQKLQKQSKRGLNTSRISRSKFLIQDGKKLYKQNRVEQAQKYFEEASEIDPDNLEIYYFLGIIHIGKKKFQKSIQCLKKIINKKSDYRKTVYLFLCISLKNLHKNQEAIFIASQAIKLYPDYFDLILYRAKLYQIDSIFDLALNDFNLAIAIQDNSAEAYFKKGLCLYSMKQYKEAINMLTTALNLDQGYKYRVLIQRCKAYLQINELVEAKKDIEIIMSNLNNYSEVYQLKGCLHTKQGLVNQAILSFEQCIKLNTSKKSVSKALIEITKFKIKVRDFYSAYYHISRSEFLQIQTPQIQMYKLFTEGVIFLMKRKIIQGIQNLNILKNKFPHMDQFLIKLFFLYRAYGYFVSNDHQKCLLDYYEAEIHSKKDKHNIYNMYLAEGIILCQKQDFQKGFQYFNKAQELVTTKIQPYLYKAATYITISCKFYNDNEIKKLQNIFAALKQLDKGNQINNGNSNLCYLRALIYFYLGKINEGIQDIQKAISKSEENIPKYFYYRGLANGSLKNYRQAQNDLTICINLDENYEQAYIERAKVYFLQRQISKSFQDIKKYVQFRPKQNLNLLQGNLYFCSGQIQDAIKKYESSEQTKDILFMKSKSYFSIGEYQKCFVCLKRFDTLYPGQNIVDSSIIQLLIILNQDNPQKKRIEELSKILKISKISNNSLFDVQHYYHYLGICYFYLEDYRKALQQFNKAYKQRQLINIQLQMQEKELREIQNNDNEQSFVEEDYYQKEFNQINYNMFLCYLKIGQYKKSYELFIRDILPAKQNVFQNQSLGQLSHLIFQQIKKNDQTQNQIKKQLEITLFDNQLSSTQSYIEINLKSGSKLKTKLCVLVPSLHLKSMYPEIKSKQIIHKINLTEVDNKPEPPWVKRNSEQSLFFTNNVQQIQNLQFNTEQNEQNSQKSDSDLSSEQSVVQQQQSGQQSSRLDKQHNVKQMDLEKIKNEMKLDNSIEKKLYKILKKKKSQLNQ